MDPRLSSIDNLRRLSEFVVRKRFGNPEVPRPERPDELAEDGKSSSIRAETGLTNCKPNLKRTGLSFQAMKKV
jgi:hypothetical protein